MAPYNQQHGRSFLHRKGNPLENRTCWCKYGYEETGCPIFGISHLTPLSVGGRCTQPFHQGRSNRAVHLQVSKGTGVEGNNNNNNNNHNNNNDDEDNHGDTIFAFVS